MSKVHEAVCFRLSIVYVGALVYCGDTRECVMSRRALHNSSCHHVVRVDGCGLFVRVSAYAGECMHMACIWEGTRVQACERARGATEDHIGGRGVEVDGETQGASPHTAVHVPLLELRSHLDTLTRQPI